MTLLLRRLHQGFQPFWWCNPLLWKTSQQITNRSNNSFSWVLLQTFYNHEFAFYYKKEKVAKTTI